MAIFYGISNLPEFKKPAVTIGTFDGVHSGHKKILQEVVKHAAEINGESIVITFEPHPRKLLFPEQSLKLLTSLDQKIQLITAEGISHIVIVPFNKEFANLSAKEYIESFLVKYFHPEIIIIGYDHHFGHDRTGNIEMLREFDHVFGYTVQEIPALLVDEAAVSSTKIRNALFVGKVEDAAHMIGRHYSLSGIVTEGQKLGRTIGFPTANIKPTDFDQLIPANGVYAVRIKWKEHLHNAMLNIGYRPTVSDEKTLSIEAHIFDFNEDIYNATLDITFISRIRDEQKFPSLDALKQQLADDRQNALKALSESL